MTATSEASRLVNLGAREVLQPLGLRRWGRSRLWLDDRGWWLVVVEFQPSRSPGTYLNVGAMWLWHTTDHIRFDEGGRVTWRPDGAYFVTVEQALGLTGIRQYLDFRSPEQFAQDVRFVAEIAGRRAGELREQFRDPVTVGGYLAGSPAAMGVDAGWRAYHAGVAAGLCGDELLARQCFGRVTASTTDPPWAVERAGLAADLSTRVGDTSTFRSVIEQRIAATRQALQVPALNPPVLPTHPPT